MTSEAARVEHWDYKLEAWPLISEAQPNAVHGAIVQLERADKILMVVTQNIDGLHSLAGTSRDRLIELHGTNSLVECQTCHWRGDPRPHLESFRANLRAPLCSCGGFLKFATISFGQSLDPDSLERASEAARKSDLVVALGSTLSVYPAASLPLMAAQRGIPYVIINRGATDQDDNEHVSLRLDGDVAEVFPRSVGIALRQER
jgi:NAD-dependent deacetylase